MGRGRGWATSARSGFAPFPIAESGRWPKLANLQLSGGAGSGLMRHAGVPGSNTIKRQTYAWEMASVTSKIVKKMHTGIELETKIRINRNRIEFPTKNFCQNGRQSRDARGLRMVGLKHKTGRNEYPIVRRHDTIRRTGCRRMMITQRVLQLLYRWVKFA